MNSKSLSNVKTVATVGVMAATLECAKLVLSFLPNIEIVSIMTAVFGYVFGLGGVIAAFIFVLIEPLIWGFGPWFITYLIYWPALAAVFMLLRKREVRSRVTLTAVALGMTLLFGVVSSIVDCALYVGVNEYYFKNLLLYYLRGVGFYLTQLACNAVLFPTLFLLLTDRLTKIKSSLDLGKM
jgi:energy-coupling factor transport system substrate-specific component